MSFEEYLAACYLQEMPKGMVPAAQLAGDPAWREVVRFLGESLCFGRRVSLYQAQELLECLCSAPALLVDAEDWRRVWLAGELLQSVRKEAKIGRTSAVGSFPAGASQVWRNSTTNLTALEPCQDTPFDMAGNVWEWCSTRWKDTYLLPDLDGEWDRDYLEGDARRVLRGGAWWNDQARCRGAARRWYIPAYRYLNRGFRCCVSTPSR